MKLQVGGEIIISDATKNEEAIITSGLSLINPTYAVMKRQGNIRALYAVPQFIKYYRKSGNDIVVGRGVWPRLFRHFYSNIEYVATSLSDNKIDDSLRSNINLRDYQRKTIIDLIKNDSKTGELGGIIKLGTGWGKSILALELINLTRRRTLIIVPRLNLLKQFKSDIKTFFNYDCGIINGNTFIIKDITVATIQTLKKRNLAEISYEFGMVIADECHTLVSSQGIKTIAAFHPRRLYGMTATPDRSDGQGEAIKFMFGDILVDEELPQAKPVVSISCCDQVYFGDTYSTIIDDQVESEVRNSMLINIINNELNDKRKVIVLTKRVKHYELLFDKIERLGCNKYKIDSKLSAEATRKQTKLLDDLRKGNADFDIIFGTFSLLSTGIDIPALDTIILAGDLKSNVLTTQSVGRILRLFEGKPTPKIIDIDDHKSGILHNQARLRKKFYKEKGWEIL